MENTLNGRYLSCMPKYLFPQVSSEDFAQSDIIPVRSEHRKMYNWGFGILHETVTAVENDESGWFRIRVHTGIFRINEGIPEFLATSIKADSEKEILFFLEDVAGVETALMNMDIVPALTRFEVSVGSHAAMMIDSIMALSDEEYGAVSVTQGSELEKWVPLDKNSLEIAKSDGRFIFTAAFVSPDNGNELNIVLLKLLNEDTTQKLTVADSDNENIRIEGFFSYEKATEKFKMFEFWHAIMQQVHDVVTGKDN